MTGVKQDNRGYSFIETIAAVGIFSMVVLITGSLMQNITMSQRSSITSQNTQENMRFIFESVSKEMRNAKRASSTCTTAAGATYNYKVFNTNATSSVLSFVNKKGQCVFYRLEDGRMKIRRGANDFFASPDEIDTYSLQFHVVDEPVSAPHDIQPRVTMTLRMRYGKLDTSMQTTISTRHYE